MNYNFNKFKINSNEKNKEYLLNEIINYDNIFYQTYDKQKYYVTKKRIRTFIFELGKLTFNRRIYKNKLTGECIAFTDLYFGLEKRKRIINNFKENIKNQLGSGKRYKDIKDMFYFSNISLISISRILKNAKVNIKLPIEKIKVFDKLYSNFDDCYQYLINENNKVEKYCIRIFSFNTGKENVSKNRNKLLNKKIAFMIFKPSEKIQQDKVYEFLIQTIKNNYDIKIKNFRDLDSKNNNIIIGGDGALWIRAIARWLGAYYILDKFHAFSYLWKSFVKVRGKKKNDTNWSKYIDTSTNLATGKYELLINGLKNNVDKKIFNYFKNNEQGIINQNADWNKGCSAESDVFHLVKSLKGNGAKIYNFNTFNNMLIARANHINNVI